MRGIKRVEEDILLTFYSTVDISRMFLSFLSQFQRLFFLKLLPAISCRGLSLMFILKFHVIRVSSSLLTYRHLFY